MGEGEGKYIQCNRDCLVFVLTCIYIRCNVVVYHSCLLYVFTFNVALGPGNIIMYILVRHGWNYSRVGDVVSSNCRQVTSLTLVDCLKVIHLLITNIMSDRFVNAQSSKCKYTHFYPAKVSSICNQYWYWLKVWYRYRL